VNSNISRCYSVQPFFTGLQCSAILVNSVISRATVLIHFLLSYSAQPFSTAIVLSHLQMATINLFIFAILLSHFMILSAILEIMSVILLQPRSCYDFLSHSQDHVSHFSTMLNHFAKLLRHSRVSIIHSLK
jgi:hypothetical protein